MSFDEKPDTGLNAEWLAALLDQQDDPSIGTPISIVYQLSNLGEQLMKHECDDTWCDGRVLDYAGVGALQHRPLQLACSMSDTALARQDLSIRQNCHIRILAMFEREIGEVSMNDDLEKQDKMDDDDDNDAAIRLTDSLPYHAEALASSLLRTNWTRGGTNIASVVWDRERTG